MTHEAITRAAEATKTALDAITDALDAITDALGAADVDPWWDQLGNAEGDMTEAYTAAGNALDQLQ